MTFYHLLRVGDITADRQLIRCPSCDHTTEIDPPDWECEHCGETLALFVGWLDEEGYDDE